MADQEVSSEVLRREIQAQSETEASGILEQAEKNAEKIQRQAAQDAEKGQEKTLEDARIQAAAIRKKLLSSVHLEVKKQTLNNREAIFDRMFEEVRKKLKDFRSRPEYVEFLKSCVIEGVMAVEADAILIRCGKIEKERLSPDVIQFIQKALLDKGRQCRLELADSGDDEGGVLIQSADGRMRFDNRFQARIRRMEHRLRLEVMKTVFA